MINIDRYDTQKFFGILNNSHKFCPETRVLRTKKKFKFKAKRMPQTVLMQVEHKVAARVFFIIHFLHYSSTALSSFSAVPYTTQLLNYRK
jgi:hypothetical protein